MLLLPSSFQCLHSTSYYSLQDITMSKVVVVFNTVLSVSYETQVTYFRRLDSCTVATVSS